MVKKRASKYINSPALDSDEEIFMREKTAEADQTNQTIDVTNANNNDSKRTTALLNEAI